MSFIVIEGLDSVGKTVQNKLLVEHLSKHYDVISTRDPGGSPQAEVIRDLILSDADKHSPDTQLALHMASRLQMYHDVMGGHSDKVVVCDRWVHSTYAYQGGLGGIAYKRIDDVMKAFNIPIPDLTIVLEISAEERLNRLTARGVADAYERMLDSNTTSALEGYAYAAKVIPNTHVLDVSGLCVLETHNRVLELVSKHLGIGQCIN